MQVVVFCKYVFAFRLSSFEEFSNAPFIPIPQIPPPSIRYSRVSVLTGRLLVVSSQPKNIFVNSTPRELPSCKISHDCHCDFQECKPETSMMELLT